MTEETRFNSRRIRQRKDRIHAAIITTLFIACSIVIFATKYKNEFTDWFHINNSEGTTASIATPTDTVWNATGTDPVPDTTEDLAEPQTKDTTTEAAEENTTAEPEEDVKGFLEYVNTRNPDLSRKGDDWYNTDIYTPANASDDAFFDTALLIGDSRTEGLVLYTGLSNLDAFCSKGLNIDKVMTDPVVQADDGGMQTVLDALTDKQYDNIYISFGLNELGWAYDYLFIEAYQVFIDAVKEVEPDATIYVENILPVSQALSEEDEIYNNPKIESYNALLKEMCQEYEDVIYLDVASSVAENGVLPADASTDGRHCNRDYCEKWLDYIRQNVYVKKQIQE